MHRIENMAAHVAPVPTTAHSPVLSAEQLAFYAEHGYVVIRKLVSEESIARWNGQFQEICEGRVELPGALLMKDVSITKSEFAEGAKAISKLQGFHLDPVS
jgi:hypothetical protein